MIERGAEVYIQFAANDPGAPGPERCLHPGRIVEGSGSSYLGEFRLKRRSFEPGTEALLYREIGGRFLQSWVSIQAMEVRGREWRLWLDVVGAPRSAESRQWQRVAAAGQGVRLTLGKADSAEILDLGVNGFSASSAECYAIGDVLDAELFYKGRGYRSRVEIKSANAMPEGDTHYGVLCIDAEGNPNPQGFPDIYLALLRARGQGPRRREDS